MLIPLLILFNNNNNNNNKHLCPSALAFDSTSTCICSSEIADSIVDPNDDYFAEVLLQIVL
jgi:hypothetical protein